MKHLLLALTMVVAIGFVQSVNACGGMTPEQLAAFLARFERFLDPPAPPATPTPPAAPANDPTPPPAPPVYVAPPPPPPPPPMVQLSPSDINGGLRLESTTTESQNEQVTQDCHEGLVIS